MSPASLMRDLGVPVRSVCWVQLIAGVDAQDKPALYATMGQNAEPLFILQIDPTTGTFSQYSVGLQSAQFPTAAKWSESEKCLYVGSAYAGHLHRFDPRTSAFEDLGAINPPGDTFPCRIDEGPDGTIWIGCYGTAGLTSLDSKTGSFTRYGRMDDVDMYFYPLVGEDGTVAGLVQMTKPHVVVLDPDSGRHKPVGPVIDTDARSGEIDLIKGADGRLYIVSTEGNFRIDGLEVVPVDSAPQPRPEPTLPDASSFRFADADSFEHRQLEITSADGAKRTFHLDWKGAGTNIFLIHEGPDGCVCGSTILPLRLFRYDRESDEMSDLGQCSLSGGEVYSAGDLDGRLYLCSYPQARLSVYDPTRPFRFGTDEGANPRDLGRMDDVSYRPVVMVAGPLGRVWTGSYPDYGMWGGPLAWYDPKTGEFGSCRHVLKDQSVCSLAWLEGLGLIAGGTSIQGGTGTLPRADCAGVFLWDPQGSKKVWDSNFGLPIYSVMDLRTLMGSLAYAVLTLRDGEETRNELVLIDFDRGALLSRSELPDDAIHLSLRRTPEGRIYGSTRSAFYQVEPGTTTIKLLVSEGLDISVPGPVVADTFYFATGHVLRALTIPD